jgi:hypothetical protein
MRGSSAMHNEGPACRVWGKDKLPSCFCVGGAERLKCSSQYFRIGNSCGSAPLTDWLQIAPLNNPTSKLLKLRWGGMPCDVIRLTLRWVWPGSLESGVNEHLLCFEALLSKVI